MAKGFRGGMGMGGNMSQVMAQAQRMQRQIEMAQAEIQEMRFTGTAGGELVKRVLRSQRMSLILMISKVSRISSSLLPTRLWHRSTRPTRSASAPSPAA